MREKERESLGFREVCPFVRCVGLTKGTTKTA